MGLLGGSFNPAHAGHRHISLVALAALDVDEIWWLVSPQNPLKARAGMAPLAERLADAARVAAHPRIKVTALETALGTRYTADTLRQLVRRFSRTRFVWLMGADNLRQLRRWERWQQIFRLAAVAVVDRPSYSLGALASLPAVRFARARVRPRQARGLSGMPRPAWAFFRFRLEPLSATHIRQVRAQRPSAHSGPADFPGASIRLQHQPLAAAFPVPDSDVERASDGESGLQPPVLDIIRHTLDEGKAEDVIVIDLEGRSSVTDHWVIASGRSSRQVTALAEQIASALKDAGHGKPSTEGTTYGDWVLIDAGDVVVHLFRPEVRRFYNLEKIWGVEPPPDRNDGLMAEPARAEPILELEDEFEDEDLDELIADTEEVDSERAHSDLSEGDEDDEDGIGEDDVGEDDGGDESNADRPGIAPTR